MNSTPPTCPVCRTTLHSYLESVVSGNSGEDFSLWRCPSCELIQTLPQPEDLSFYYSQSYYANRHGRLKDYRFRKRGQRVASLFRDRHPPLSLLDIGCGDGSFLNEMTAKGWDVMGTELSPDPALLESGRVKERIEEVHSHAPFDCITLWHSLEHMTDIPQMLDHIRALLSPEGKVVIAVPNIHSTQARLFKEAWLALDVPRHLFHFSKPSLTYALESAGFHTTHFDYQEFEYDVMGWVQSVLNRFFQPRNIFFDRIRGLNPPVSSTCTLVHLFTGFCLLPFSIPAVLLERMRKKSGTILVTAVKANPA